MKLTLFVETAVTTEGRTRFILIPATPGWEGSLHLVSEDPGALLPGTAYGVELGEPHPELAAPAPEPAPPPATKPKPAPKPVKKAPTRGKAAASRKKAAVPPRKKPPVRKKK